MPNTTAEVWRHCTCAPYGDFGHTGASLTIIATHRSLSWNSRLRWWP